MAITVSPRLVPFRAEHLLAIASRNPFDNDLIDGAYRKEVDGPGFTAFVDDKVLACAGVLVERPGVGFAWTVFGHDFPRYAVWLTRTIKLALRDIIRGCKLHRVEAHVLESQSVERKWIELFGFEPESVAHEYTSDRRHVVRYEFLPDKPYILRFGSDSKPAFVAQVGNMNVGYAAHAYTPEGYAYGLDVRVDAAYQGRGIGKLLHKARLCEAARHGASFFVGTSENPAMIRVLEWAGARRCENSLGITYVCKLGSR